MRVFTAGVYARQRYHNTVSGLHRLPTRLMGQATTLVNVGGVNHIVFDEDLAKHQNCVLSQIITNHKQNSPDLSLPVNIERDGSLFKHVNAFLVNGQLSKELDCTTVDALRKEAVYYNIKRLQEECSYVKQHSTLNLDSYLRLRRTANKFKSDECAADFVNIVTLQSQLESEVLRSCSSSCVSGDDFFVWSSYKQELLDAVAHLAPSNYSTTEHDASEISSRVVEMISCRYDMSPFAALAPQKELSLALRKVVINLEGGSYVVEPREMENNLVGTLVVAVSSEEGAENFHISRYADSEPVETVREWVAFTGDCSLTVEPAASGTRILLVFDILGHEDANPGNVEKYRTENWSRCIDSNSHTGYRVYRDHNKWRSGYQGLNEDSSPAHFYTDFSVDRKQYVLDAVKLELCGARSVTIGTRDLYLDSNDRPSQLNPGDRALYDLLSEHYSVDVVSVLVHERIDVYDSSTSIKASFLPLRSTSQGTAEKHKLVLPHQLSDRNELEYTEECGCGDPLSGGGQDQEAVFVVSGLRVSERV